MLTPEFLKSCVENAWMIVALPFFAGFAIITSFLLTGPKLGAKRWFKTLAMFLSVGAVAVGFLHSLSILYALITQPALSGYQQNFDWFVCENFKLSVGFLVDNLCASMLVVVTTISLLVQIYTHGYMREDPGYARFYSYLSLFTGSMLGLVVSTNLFEMYGFWELVGVCSYLLIGFWFYKNSAAAACLKAFVVNRVGDFGFLIGILLLYLATKDYWGGGTILAFLPQLGTTGADMASVLQMALQDHRLTPELAFLATSMPLIAILIFMGPMAKSAQAPLHIWLPDAMEGPTPISALIHAATMVAAGVYLVARAYPIFLAPDGSTNSIALSVVAAVGAFTAFMAATIALTQFDIKRVLAWSTCSQLGYMFVGLGVGAYGAGMFHLFTHAFFKAMLFLCSGAVIHGLHHEQDIRRMGGLWKPMNITGWCFLIGTASIAGWPLPPLSGFFSKDEIVSAAWHQSPLLGGILILTAGLTAFYMFRLFFLVFTGEYRGNTKAHEVPVVMWAPLVALAVPSCVAGFMLGFNKSSFFENTPAANPFGSFIYWAHPHQEVVDWTMVIASSTAGLIGVGIAYLMYYARTVNFHKDIVEKQGPLYLFSLNKWYWDELYLGLVNKVFLPIFDKTWKTLDSIFVDQILVNGASIVTLATGEVLKYTQTGKGQYYALVIFFWVAVIAWLAFLTTT
ncbi:MAG: NADH-quinone oxidoreductase subunit L [Candidatus Melainabacteria bacterium]|nr:NADH-quinone oxidoreductase subunit L [Candidatus Melainabacteria bacterium]